MTEAFGSFGELRSPYPVIPPLKDSRLESPPKEDAESHPDKKPKLYPDIGEPHPCPYFRGLDLDFRTPQKKVKIKPVFVPAPVPVPIPAPVPIPRRIRTPEPAVPDSMFDELFTDQMLNELLHRIAWDCVAEWGKEVYTREIFAAKVSKNTKKYVLDKGTMKILMEKLFRKTTKSNWGEKCHKIDRLPFDVLACGAYKAMSAKMTVESDALSKFHKKTVFQAVLDKTVADHSTAVDKALKKQDSNELKNGPPRKTVKSS